MLEMMFSVLSCLVVLIVYSQRAAHQNKVGVVNQGDEPPEAFNVDAEKIKKMIKYTSFHHTWVV